MLTTFCETFFVDLVVLKQKLYQVQKPTQATPTVRWKLQKKSKSVSKTELDFFKKRYRTKEDFGTQTQFFVQKN